MRREFIIIILFGFIAGVSFSSFVNFGWFFALFFIFLGGVFGITYFLTPSPRHRMSRGGGGFLGVIALLFIAVGLGQLRYHQDDLSGRQSDLQNKIEQRVALSGIVAEEPEQKENYARIVLETEKKDKILVYIQNYPQFKYGDKLKINGVLKKPENFQNKMLRNLSSSINSAAFSSSDNNFNWPDYLAKDGIYYETFYPRVEFISSGNGFWLKEKLFSLKRNFLSALSKNIPEPHSSFLGGITVGARDAMPKELRDEFKITGVAHIVALSGYNITIVAETIMLVLSFLPRYLAIGGGVIGIILFAVMTGASATVLRASIMALIGLSAKATGRIYTVSWALFLAGFFMILQNPKILRFDISFQLSFLATMGLIYLSPFFEKKLKFIPQKFKLREVSAITVSAQIFVLPLLIYKMGAVSLVSFPVNFLILPFMPLTMFFGFATGIMGMFSELLSVPLAWISFVLLQYELWIIKLFSEIPFASINIRGFSEIFLVLSYTGIILMAIKLSNASNR